MNKKEIIHKKFSLFRLEKSFYPAPSYVGQITNLTVQSCFEYINTFDSLDEAKLAQKDIEMKTIILPSY